MLFGEEVRRGASEFLGVEEVVGSPDNTRKVRIQGDREEDVIKGVVCHEVKSTSLYDRSLHMHWS